MAEDGLASLVNQVRKYIEFGRRVLKHWLLIGVISLIGVGASLAVALTSTRIYQSRAMVAYKPSIDRASIGWEGGGGLPENFLRDQVGQFTASNTMLLTMARTLDLYPKEREVAAPEVILDYIRQSISFNSVGNDSFWIAYEYKDKALAQKACAYLVNQFIDQNIKEKLQAASATQAFMEEEAAKVKTQLKKIEADLAAFVAEHPEFQIDPATGMPRGTAALRRGPGGRKAPSRLARRLLAHSTPELRETLSAKGRLQAELVGINPRGRQRLSRAQEDVAAARRTLAALKRKYTERHPDVLRAMKYLKQMNMQLAAARKAQTVAGGRATSIRKRLADMDRKISQLSRPKSKKSPKKKVKKKVKKTPPAEPVDLIRQGINAAAKLEQRWYELDGERQVARAKNEQIQAQLQRSELSTGIERKQAEKEYAVIDKASFPGKPVRPSRKKIVLAGSALGLMLGLGLAGLLVIFDPRIYNEDDLRKATNLPVLAQIPKED